MDLVKLRSATFVTCYSRRTVSGSEMLAVLVRRTTGNLLDERSVRQGSV